MWDIDRHLATQYRTRAPSLSRQHSVIPSFLAVNLCYGVTVLHSAVALLIFTGERFYRLQCQLHTGGGCNSKQKEDFLPWTSALSLAFVWKCLSVLFIHLFCSNNSSMHIYPCFSLHPGINVLHHPNNRAPNYENFLFKRLFSFSKKLFNCSTQPYQRKSGCPCQKTRVLLRHQRTVSPLQIIHSFTFYADVYQDNKATCHKNAFFSQNH